MPLSQKIEYVAALDVQDMPILENCVINIFDNSLSQEASQLCNLMGAMTTDTIIPFLTTHIVTNKITPTLRQTLNSIQMRAFESINNKNNSSN